MGRRISKLRLQPQQNGNFIILSCLPCLIRGSLWTRVSVQSSNKFNRTPYCTEISTNCKHCPTQHGHPDQRAHLTVPQIYPVKLRLSLER